MNADFPPPEKNCIQVHAVFLRRRKVRVHSSIQTTVLLSFATKMVPSQTRCAPASEVCTCGVTRESADQSQPRPTLTLQAFVNRNFAAGRGSRIRNRLHQTLSLLTDKDRRTDCWIRRKQNMIRNNPDKSEFSNLLQCVLCTRLLILKAHDPSKKVNLQARWREIYCKMYSRTKRSSIAVVVYLLFY